MKTNTVLVLACSVVESMMHGVVYFKFAGNQCTAHYTDGSTESAEIPQALSKAMQDYHNYQNENGPESDAPNSFALVSAIQSKRPIKPVLCDSSEPALPIHSA